MSSLIPKIRIGRDTKRNHFDISCMTHTTSEIGYVQPTFGRTIVPNSKVCIGTRTGSRLSPLFVPTMGKIDIRHYHCFVPYTTIWSPFDAFITRQNYTLVNGVTYVPQNCPSFTFKNSLGFLLGINANYSSGYDPTDDLTACFFLPGGGMMSDSAINALNSSHKTDYFIRHLPLGIMPRYVISEEGTLFECGLQGSEYFLAPLDQSGNVEYLKGKLAFPTNTNFDFNDVGKDAESNGQNIHVAYNFNGGLKRLRTIFMGLGYSFNPYDDVKVTPFKLLAFYKAYFALFGVNREKNFFNTYCYKVIKTLSETGRQDLDDISNNPQLVDLWLSFLRIELSSCTYTCPVDYFSVADTTTQRGANSETIYSPVSQMYGTFVNVGATDDINQGTISSVPIAKGTGWMSTSSAWSPLAQQIALRLLRFVNKNSVVGRKISDILRARYGVTDLHNQAHESVIRVGASSTDIEIAAIYSNTDTPDLPLGSYAGAGMSNRQSANSKTFTFETNEFGVLLTLTAVVPKMGYWQGMFRENSDGVNDYTEFYQPEFDGLGWQGVRMNELVADRQARWFNTPSTKYGTNLGIWGFVPRMTHLKVGFNRCLGDISIPHMQDSMLPYTLDRNFKSKRVNQYGTFDVTELPINEAQSFRAGTQGDTNRIFSDMSPTEDHVIMQIFFDVKMSAPMKSISTSYDTWDEESKQSVDVAHE